MVIRSRRLRPSLSGQTMSVSPDSSVSRQRSRAGRLIVAPDGPSFLNTVFAPGFFQGGELQGSVVVIRRYSYIAIFHAVILLTDICNMARPLFIGLSAMLHNLPNMKRLKAG